MKQPLAFVLAALALAGPARAQQAVLDADRTLVRGIYKELIELNTTHSTGSTTRAAEQVAARLRSAGIPDADIAQLGPAPDKGNIKSGGGTFDTLSGTPLGRQ